MRNCGIEPLRLHTVDRTGLARRQKRFVLLDCPNEGIERKCRCSARELNLLRRGKEFWCKVCGLHLDRKSAVEEDRKSKSPQTYRFNPRKPCPLIHNRRISMPKSNSQPLKEHKNPTGRYGFSATKIEDLQATEYTLVTLVLDESGSTDSFEKQIERCVQGIVEACRRSSQADNLLLRLVAFGTTMREVHGFKLLEQCDPSNYDNLLQPAGCTALYDSAENGIRSSLTYAEQLSRNAFLTNGIVFVLTDGDDNASLLGMSDVKAALQDTLRPKQWSR